MRDPMVINAVIDSFWNDRHQAWEGTVDLTIGHVCNCGHCARTGLSIQGVVSTGRNQREAWAVACKNMAISLSAIQGVRFSIITAPGSKEVQFSADIVDEEENWGGEEEGTEEEDFEYSR